MLDVSLERPFRADRLSHGPWGYTVAEYAKGFLYSVPFVLVLWPLFLLGLSRITDKEG